MGRDTRRARLLLAALLALALVLITIDYRMNGTDSKLRSGVHDVVAPFERGIDAVTSPVGNLFDNRRDAASERKRADALSTRVDDLQRQVAAGQEAQRLAAQLEQLRLLADRGSYSIVPTRVIAVGDPTGTEQTVDVDAGTEDGLVVGQLVIASAGLVGVVQRTGASTSTVRLATDPATTIGARLEGSEALGTVTGSGTVGGITFTLYDPSLPLLPGQRVVTYGSRDYAGGVPIGTVSKLVAGTDGLNRRAQVTPFVGFGSLDLLGVVVRRPNADPGDRLLPPRPVSSTTPTPTPSPKSSPTSRPSAAAAG